MNPSWVAFIESNTTGTGRLFAKAVSRNGHRPVLLAEQPERYPFVLQDAVCCIRCNTRSLVALASALEILAGEAPVAGIFSSSEYFVETAAALAEKFHLCGPNLSALKTCRNKWTQRQRLRDCGVATPGFARITSIAALDAAITCIPLPVIVKPTMGSGSVGVRLCRTMAEVVQHATFLLGCGVNERGMPILPELLVEEYLVGPEYSVEAFHGSVFGITRKHVSEEPFFVETGHDFPARVSKAVENSVIDLTQNALGSLGLKWGPAHVELRVTTKGPVIVEVNPRLAGGFIPEIMRLASGVDMIQQTVKLVVGTRPEISPSNSRHASIRFLISPGQGIIRGIAGAEKALNIEGVSEVQIYRKIGDHIRIEHDFRDRIGHVIAVSDLEEAAERACELGCDEINIQVGS